MNRMDNDVVISVENVTMAFNLNKEKVDNLKEYVIKLLRRQLEFKKFYALQDINFQVRRGQHLGILGLNGAGKSTLLKTIVGVYKPTEGTVKKKGVIAPLLELGAGFDPNYTGKENIFLYGAILGYNREYLERKYDEIVAFSELGKFIDVPLKNYSSGMKARLGFSIATAVEPDILILDEVLSVGDGAFRKKSGDKMKQILAGGVTGILVSHSVDQVREMCNKLLWLDHGKQIYFGGDTEMVCNAYEEFLITKKLPENPQDIKQLSENYIRRKKEEQRKRQMSEAQKLQSVLESGSSDAAVEAALAILRKNKPELLK